MVATFVDSIVETVITELSQVPGAGTQLYASDRIRQFVQNAWLLEIEAAWWPDYMVWFNVGLDGVTGQLTHPLIGPISGIQNFSDVQVVFPVDSNRRLRALPPLMNPYVLTGNQPVYLYPDAVTENKPFRIWPTTATGSVAVFARQREAIPFTSASLTYLDPILLMYDAAWMYAVDDGTVPQQVQKYQQLATKRRQQLIANISQQPIPLDSRGGFGGTGQVVEGAPGAGGGGDGDGGGGVPADDSFFILDTTPLA